ncbi:MAG: xanthine dehydrogenase family protein subunit M [Deltaproteobacteria bacterium]|nr:xanthine dehydrogenase family protein subunit M [Deltaproteobacteria bacterium]
MFLPDFDYYAPASLGEATDLLTRLGPSARVLAGGTDILVKMKNGLLAPSALVSLKHLRELRNIRWDAERGLVIGALATHNEICNSAVAQERFLSLSEAAHKLANNQVRNRGTIGGNLVNAIPSADLPPILIALGAHVTLAGPDGSRAMPVERFFTGVSCCALDPQREILTEVVIPPQETTGSTYIKFGLRRSGALAVVGVAAAVTMDGDMVKDARICLGAVYKMPTRAIQAEQVLIGKGWTDDLLEQSGRAAVGCCLPISDIRGSAEYRRDLVRIFTRRALKRAITKGHV